MDESLGGDPLVEDTACGAVPEHSGARVEETVKVK
jgi:hypothetical protein